MHVRCALAPPGHSDALGVVTIHAGAQRRIRVGLADAGSELAFPPSEVRLDCIGALNNVLSVFSHCLRVKAQICDS